MRSQVIVILTPCVDGRARLSQGEEDVRDVRRVPSERSGHCSGSKIMYIDHQIYHQVWEEIYDANLKLWKIVHIGLHPAEITPGEGLTPLDGSLIESYGDLQNDHVSHVFTANPDGKTDGLIYNKLAPPEYNNITKYSTSGGLMMIMH